MGLPLNIDVVQILLHMLNLVVLVGALTLLLYRPVIRFLRERRAYFEDREREIEEKTADCARMKAEYEEKLASAEESARQTRAAAERDAAAHAARSAEAAQAKADAILAAAAEEAETRKAHLLESAQTEIGELVLSAAQKLLADAATPESDKALYDAFLREAASEAERPDDHE